MTTITGTSGNDILTSDGANDSMTGGGGADQFVFAYPLADFPTLTDFQTGQDQIVVSGLPSGWNVTIQVFYDHGAPYSQVSLHDASGQIAGGIITVYGTIPQGTDIVSGGGRTAMFGSDQGDDLHVTGPNAFVNGEAGNDTIWTGDGGSIVYGWTGDDTIHGGAGADSVVDDDGITPGNDTFYGGGGNDTFRSLGGNDYFDGGPGSDLLDLNFAPGPIHLDLTLDGVAQTYVGGSITLVSVENVNGSAYDDVITAAGSSVGHVLDGAGGNDTLIGGNGDDLLFGGSGNDILVGGAGADMLSGNGGVDTLTGGAGADTFIGSINAASSQHAGDDSLSACDTITDFEPQVDRLVLQANGYYASANVLIQLNTGGLGAVVYADVDGDGVHDGKMVLSGGSIAAADVSSASAAQTTITLIGTAGDDVLQEGSPRTGGISTAISYANATAGVTVDLDIQGVAQDTVGAGRDTLVDVRHLVGSAFADRLSGGTFGDTLSGGGGADTFVVEIGDNTTVTDFNPAEGDRIDLSAFMGFNSLAQVIASSHQVGADLVLVWDMGEVLTLRNVSATSLTAADFVFASLPTQMTSNAPLAFLPQDQTMVSSGSSVVQYADAGAETFYNSGAMTLTGSGAVVGVAFYGAGGARGHLTNNATGVLQVTGDSAQGTAGYGMLENWGAVTVTATGEAIGAGQGSIENFGVFTVQGSTAIGVKDAIAGGQDTNGLGGALSVTSSGGPAVGFENDAGGAVWNSGSVVVTGASAIGVLMQGRPGIGAQGWTSSVVSNSGTLAVHGAGSIGIEMAVGRGSFAGADTTTVLNYGQLSGDTAILYGPGVLPANVTNAGQIDGTVVLSEGADTLNNTGVIDGDIRLGGGADVLISTLGAIHGVVWVGAGASSISLGADDNTVVLTSGDSTLDGGGGLNTLSFATAMAGVRVDLGREGQPQAVGIGSVSMSNFQNLVGSAYNDTLEGGGSASTGLTGAAGADTFIYQSGDGRVTVQDFSAAQGDKIDLSSLAQFHSFSDLQPDIFSANNGADTVITIGAGSLTLKNTAMGSLTAADFGFAPGPSVGPGIGGIPTTGSGRLAGTAGDDWLRGQGGNDTLHGGAGSDYLDGGPGLNTAAYDGVYRQYTVGAGGGTVSGGPEGGTDVLANIQRIQFVDGYLDTSPTDPAGQVFRIYEATLGRGPDAQGLANWVQSLNTGTSLQTVANGFVNSQEFQAAYAGLDNTGFVTLLYHNVLHRNPDASGLSNWVTALNSGADTRAQVVLGFSESQEDIAASASAVGQGLWVGSVQAAEAARLYDTVFGRLPDAGGLANWVNSLNTGTSLQTAATGFVASQEFQSKYGALDNTAFVTLLYHNVLHRDPDASGLGNWVTALNSGQTRAQVVLGFSESQEHMANTAAHIDNGVWIAS